MYIYLMKEKGIMSDGVLRQSVGWELHPSAWERSPSKLPFLMKSRN
jgi:hypothetical protein